MWDIEHPDHTGSSGNPLAPWNQPDGDTYEGPYTCPDCDHEHGTENGNRDGEPCGIFYPEEPGNDAYTCAGILHDPDPNDRDDW